MRNYLTTLLWHQDRLESLAGRYLVGVGLFSGACFVSFSLQLLRFLEDLAFLLADNDMTSALIFFKLLLVTSVALWVFCCCLAALARRLLLYVRGL